MSSGGWELESKVCVVTGGGRGIGEATCVALAGEGGRIALLEQNAALATPAADRLREKGAEVVAYEVDVVDEQGVRSTAERVVRDFGRVDVLVNNAGISLLGPSMTFPIDEWNRTLDVILTGTFLCSREFGKHMRDAGGGAMVNVSSINGLVNFPMRLAYSAAKAGVISMTKILAVEWASYHIRVNAVAPGMTETEMVKQAIDQGLIDRDAYMPHLPLRRFGRPEEIADAILYLVSDRSGYITGQVLVPDGGWTAFNWIPWSGNPDAPEIGGK